MDIFDFFNNLSPAKNKLTISAILTEIRRVKSNAMVQPTRLDYLIAIDKGFNELAQKIRNEVEDV